MRFRNTSVVILALAVACASDASGPMTSAMQLARGEGTLLTGRVFGVKAGPDSSAVPVQGAQVVIYLVDSIPTDTVPVDTVPSDSMLWNGLVLRPFILDSGVVDSIPVDTVPPDTIPPDTIPPDTNPPPPPPEPGCGRTGEVVAQLRTGPGGRFRIAGLASAKYDLKVIPPQGSNFGTAFYCGVHLLPRQPAEIRIFLPPTSGLD